MKASVPSTKPPGDGWKSWDHGNPYSYSEVETWRRGRMETNLCNPRDMHPLTNVFGLFWRPAGPQLTPEAYVAWRVLG